MLLSVRFGRRRLLTILIVGLLGVLTSGVAHPGVGIVRDGKGRIFYTDLARVWMIDPAGARSVAVPNVHTHELYVDSLDNLYGEHLWYEGDATARWGHRVWRRTPDGRVADIIPARQGFRDDHDAFHFDWDGSGRMYWADRGTTTSIRRRDASGRVTTLVTGIREAGRFTVTPDARVFYVEGGNLRRVNPDGSTSLIARDLYPQRPLEPATGNSRSIMGLWTDADGGIFLALFGGRVVKRVAPDGSVALVTRTEPPWGPTGGLIDPGGDLWLLETSDQNAVRVRRMRAGSVIATYGP